jgi:hypothetical protein
VSAALYDAVARIARHEATARPGLALGVVVDTFDAGGAPPEHAVSVRLRDSGLVLERVPIAVGALGFAAIPAVDDLVAVAFADGDFHAPVVLGRLYHSELDPPGHTAGELVLSLPPGASTPEVGIVIRPDSPELEVTVGSDVTITATGDKVEMTAGEATATIEVGGGGRAELKVGDATLTLSGRGDITMSTTGKLSIDANEVEISGRAKAKISAPMVEVN